MRCTVTAAGETLHRVSNQSIHCFVILFFFKKKGETAFCFFLLCLAQNNKWSCETDMKILIFFFLDRWMTSRFFSYILMAKKKIFRTFGEMMDGCSFGVRVPYLVSSVFSIRACWIQLLLTSAMTLRAWIMDQCTVRRTFRVIGTWHQVVFSLVLAFRSER